MKLNKEEKDLISKEIEILESKSSAELVAVLTKRSNGYKAITSIISFSFILFISFILIFFDISSIYLLQIQLFLFIGFVMFFDKINNLLVKLLPKKYKYEKAKENAYNQFYNLGLNRTKTKQAIMFFVSFDEKYVQIISDEEISKKIDDNFWQKIVDVFIEDVKANRLYDGYLKAIKSCNKILIKSFPVKDDDVNELPNEVIELKQ